MNKDALYPFIFEHTAIRGNLATLQQSYQEALQHQALPPALKQALGADFYAQNGRCANSSIAK